MIRPSAARSLDLTEKPEPFKHPIQGVKGAPILVLCDQPTAIAASKGQAMTVEAFRIFASAAKEAGLGRDDFVFLGLCPPIAEQDSHSASRKWKHVSAHIETIKGHIEALNPKCIVTLGELATRVIVGKALAITKARGVPVERDGRMHLPMLAPGFVLYIPDHLPTFSDDLKTLARLKANNFVITETDEDKVDYKWATDLSFLLDNRPTIIGLDTETTGLTWHNPDVRVLTVQLSWGVGKAVSVPVDPEYWPDWKTRGRARAKLIAQLKELLEDENVQKVGHNLKFDVLMLRKLGIEIKGWTEDTQLMAFAMDENMMQKSLDECVRRWVRPMAGYADAFNLSVDKSRMIDVPHDIMLPYAAGDADAALRLFWELRSMLIRDQRQFNIYRRVLMPSIRTFCNNVERVGMLVDQERLASFEKEVEAWVEEEYAALIRMVPAPVRREWVEAGKPLKFTPAFLRRILFTPDGFNLTPVVFTASTAKLEDVTKREPSTSAKEHLPFFFELENEAGEFVRRIAEYQKAIKLLSTYLNGFWKYIAPNGRIYPSYKLHGTTTGRTACIRGDTMVRCETGFKRADEIKVGDKVFTHENRLQPVVNLYLKPIQEMYEIAFDNGEVLRCTEEHRLLTSSGNWISIRDVCIEETFGRPELESEDSIPLSRIIGDYGNVGSLGKSDHSHRRGDSTTGHRKGYPSEAEESQILCVENGGEEPKTGETPHQLCGGLRGWERLSNESRQWKTIFRASYSHGRSPRADTGPASGYDGHSSHRREPEEQPTGQPSTGEPIGAPGTAQSLREDFCGVRITRINPCGSYPVYDFEVAVDHSYEAAGVFSHNSENPNGQNFPKRGRWAKSYQKIFTATPGYKLINCDLSQIELRLAAWQSNDPAMLRIYANGGDIHTATAKAVSRLNDAQWEALDSASRKALRTKAKACIAEGSLVLTDKGLVPIENITRQHLVWDGIEWVSHWGVIYQGVREVVTYDGLTATPDHNVLTADGRKLELGNIIDAKVRPSLAVGEVEGAPVRFAVHNGDGDRLQRSQAGGDDVQSMLRREDASGGQPNVREDDDVSVSAWLQAGCHEGQSIRGPQSHGSRGEVRCHEAAMQQSEEHVLPGIRREGDRVTVSGQEHVHCVVSGEPSARLLSWYADRSEGQQWSLRTWEPTSSHAEGQPSQQADFCSGERVRGDGEHNGPTEGDTAETPGLRLQHTMDTDPIHEGPDSGADRAKRHVRVYDIVNAGPRHRFTVSGKIVFNCNFGFLYGMWWKKFMSYAKTDYGVTYTAKEAESTRALFFSTYRGLAPWHERTKEFVNANGYVRSLHGAIRHLPSIYSNDEGIQQGAERQAINSPIQRFGSDLGILAMTRFSLQADPELFRIIGFIHDALVMEVKDGYEKEGTEALVWCMQTLPLKEWFGIQPPIPLLAEAEIGLNGGELLEFSDLPALEQRPQWFIDLGFDKITPRKPVWWDDGLERRNDALMAAQNMALSTLDEERIK